MFEECFWEQKQDPRAGVDSYSEEWWGLGQRAVNQCWLLSADSAAILWNDAVDQLMMLTMMPLNCRNYSCLYNSQANQSYACICWVDQGLGSW